MRVYINTNLHHLHPANAVMDDLLTRHNIYYETNGVTFCHKPRKMYGFDVPFVNRDALLSEIYALRDRYNFLVRWDTKTCKY